MEKRKNIVSICASCKKLLDDQGQRSHPEHREHPASAEFSHGLCKECSERMHPEIKAGGRRKRRLIVVDDNETFCLLLKETLEPLGYYCETAFCAETALDAAQRGSFDVMITDVIMPGMDGFELIEKIKETKADLPVVVMSGFTREVYHERALAAGASDFIEKPFSIRELAAVIGRAANSARKMSPAALQQNGTHE
jgi:CheY-like chemotaxis protein